MEEWRRKPLHAILEAGVFVLTLVLWLGLLAGAVIMDIRKAQNELATLGDKYATAVSNVVAEDRMVLRGFAALFRAVGYSDPDALRRYVRDAIKDHPQIFALEIIGHVTNGELPTFLETAKRIAGQELHLKTFSYNGSRNWESVAEKAVYSPLVFAEPMHHRTSEVLGLDMDSIPFLRAPLNEAISSGVAVPTKPFNLAQGNRAFLVFYPIPADSGPIEKIGGIGQSHPRWVVDMVLDVARLEARLSVPIAENDSLTFAQKTVDGENVVWRRGDARSYGIEALVPKCALVLHP